MITLIFQIFLWLLTAFLLGLLLGWFIRPRFCKPSVSHKTNSNSNGADRGNTEYRTGSASIDAGAKTTLSDNLANGNINQAIDIETEGNTPSIGAKTESSSTGKTAAAAASLAATAIYSTTEEKINHQNSTDKEPLANEKPEAVQLAEQKRIAAEKAEAERLAEEAKAAQLAEQKRIATEKAEAERLASEEKLAIEQEEAERLALEKQLSKEKLIAEKKAEEAHISAEIEAKRLADEEAAAAIEADRMHLIEQQKLRDEQERLAEKKRLAEEAEAQRVSEEQRIIAEKARTERLAKEKRIAEEQRLDEETEIARLAKADAGLLAEKQGITVEKVKTEQPPADNMVITSTTASDAQNIKDDYDNVTDEMRPTRLTSPHDDTADDLKEISGIGPVIEKTLNTEGIYHFQQIADFTPDNVRWVDKNISIPGRVDRDDWIGQAKQLIADKGGSGVSDHMKPALLSAPMGGKAQDLKRIKGIGKVLEKRLHEMGIYHYQQIAELTEDNIHWLTDFVSFPEGRIASEDWVGQAKLLAEGEHTEYSDRFDNGETPYK